MRVLKFNEYDKLNEEEGWKTNILVGLLSVLGVQTMGHNVKDDRHLTAHTHLENTAKSYVKQGWHLDSTLVETIFSKVKVEKPDTMIMVTRIKIDKNQYFESGKFSLNQIVKDSISSAMNEIADSTGVITNIEITSSTDKQGLSTNLQKLLKDLGYTPDNQGLSKARAAGIKGYLKSMGVDESLISTQEKFEQGDNEIDQSARFVSVDIYYMITSKPLPPEDIPTTTTKKTFYLSKDVSYKHQHIRGKFKETKKLGPIKSFSNIKAYKCSRFK